MIELRPFDDLSGYAVLANLDRADHLEAELTRGAATTGLGLFADWRAVQGGQVISHIALSNGTPFAVFCLGHTGQGGVAQAALLARDHRRWHMPLARLVVAIRMHMPRFCAEQGIRRVEARGWADHPTAHRILTAIGFTHECDMPGFGPGGRTTFAQYAWLAPDISTPADQSET